MSKRVLFIINRMNFRASSGHGIFMLGVTQLLLSKGHFIDIVSDGEPEENFLSKYNVNVYTPNKKERIGYTQHNYLFQFEDSFNYEKSLNYRNAITKALTNHIYDLIICNDLESAHVCHQMGLGKRTKLTSYAHECASINPELKEGVFKDSYYELIEQMMFFPDITTLIQTKQNYIKLAGRHGDNFDNSNCCVLPYPLTDSTPISGLTRDGVLFIGRHEDRKNPAVFIKLLADYKEKYGVELKANVLTRSAHVEKFERDFESIGHTNYEIRADVIGEEKAELIQSSVLAVMPYKNESFGIAVLEALRYMPTIVLDKFNWHYNFNEFSNLIVSGQKELVDTVHNALNNFTVDISAVELEFKRYQGDFENSLMALLNDTVDARLKSEPRNKLYKYLQDNKGKYVCLETYMRTENTKGYVYLTSDIEILYSSKGWMQVTNTSEHTYVGIPDEKGNLQMPEVEHTIENPNLSSFFG